MSGPLLPYIDGPRYDLPLSFLKYVPIVKDHIDLDHPPAIHAFGALVALGVYLGSIVTLRRARERNLDEKIFNDFIFWVVATGFVLSHVLDSIFYHPDEVMRDPTYLLKIWAGLSSYGGFIGAIIGMFAWRQSRRRKIMEYCDITVSAFPLAWVFGRLGCSIVHDHPGMASNAWYALKAGERLVNAGERLVDGQRLIPVPSRVDLGTIEFFLTIPLALACHFLWKKKPLRPSGFYVGLTLTTYAPVRFFLDFLRIKPNEAGGAEADPRYAGLTPAQWVCFAALALGLYYLLKTRNAPYVNTAALVGSEPDPDAEAARDEDDEPAPRPKPKKKKKRKKAAPPPDAAPDEAKS